MSKFARLRATLVSLTLVVSMLVGSVPSASASPAPTIAPAVSRLVLGSVGERYETKLTVAGGLQGYRWEEIRISPLPPGLKLDTDGTLSGTPKKEGAFNFPVRIYNAANPAESSMHMLSMTVLPEGMGLDRIRSYLNVWVQDDAALSKALLSKDTPRAGTTGLPMWLRVKALMDTEVEQDSLAWTKRITGDARIHTLQVKMRALENVLGYVSKTINSKLLGAYYSVSDLLSFCPELVMAYRIKGLWDNIQGRFGLDALLEFVENMKVLSENQSWEVRMFSWTSSRIS